MRHLHQFTNIINISWTSATLHYTGNVAEHIPGRYHWWDSYMSCHEYSYIYTCRSLNPLVSRKSECHFQNIQNTIWNAVYIIEDNALRYVMPGKVFIVKVVLEIYENWFEWRLSVCRQQAITWTNIFDDDIWYPWTNIDQWWSRLLETVAFMELVWFCLNKPIFFIYTFILETFFFFFKSPAVNIEILSNPFGDPTDRSLRVIFIYLFSWLFFHI